MWLRISAGARVVSETWGRDIIESRENLYGEFDQVRAILEKIRLLNCPELPVLISKRFRATLFPEPENTRMLLLGMYFRFITKRGLLEA